MDDWLAPLVVLPPLMVFPETVAPLTGSLKSVGTSTPLK
jgi:hypothetical protein